MFRLFLPLLLAAVSAAAQSARAVRKIAGEAHEGDMNKGQRGPRVAILNGSGHAAASVPIALPGRVANRRCLESGTVLSMGWVLRGELGCGEGCTNAGDKPTAVARLGNVVPSDASGAAAFAVHRDGTVSACWGGEQSRSASSGRRRHRGNRKGTTHSDSVKLEPPLRPGTTRSRSSRTARYGCGGSALPTN